MDVMIDSAGAFCGILIAWIIRYIGRKTVFKFLSLEDYRKKKKEYTVLFEVFCSYSIRFVSGGFNFKNVELRRTCYKYD